jgi:hypothetical protein
MKGKVVRLLLVWVCLGFGSQTDVINFLGLPGVQGKPAASAKVVAVPDPAPGDSAFDLFIQLNPRMINLDNFTACSPGSA